MMKDGIIEVDTERGKEFGLTSDLFDPGFPDMGFPGTYLWKTGDTITISFIEVRERGQGTFGKLCRTIWHKGFRVAVPTPLGNMVKILKHYKFKKTIKTDRQMGDSYEVWIK
jgi:hypothetical protein